MKSLVVSLILLLNSSSLVIANDDASAREWLRKSWQAAGGKAWDDVVESRIEYHLVLPGLEGDIISNTDLLTGRTHSVMTLGPIRFAEGFDGQVHWQQDPSGQVQKLDSPGELEALVNTRFQSMNAHWYPNRWPATVVDMGSSIVDDKAYRRIGITPKGGRLFRLWIDESTGLIARLIENDGSRDSSMFMSDYVNYQSRRLASKLRISSGEAKYDEYVVVTKVEFNVGIDEQIFAQPAPPVDDFELAGQRTFTTVPFRFLNNHTYVKVKINGQGPFDFMLDTGGANVITTRLATALGIGFKGQLEVRGVGEKSQDLALAQIESVSVGEATIRNQTFYVLSFDDLSEAEGIVVEGLIGYEVFKRFVVRLDYERSLLTLYDPAEFEYVGNGKVVTFEFDGRTPIVDGTIDGLPGKLTFDTGSRGYVALHSPFVEANGLLQKYPEAIESITGWGVGGATRGKVLRGQILTIGDDIVLQSPIMTLSLQKSGSFTDKYQIANLGAGILSHFNLVFDYRQQRIYFENHSGTSRHDNYDRAGVWLNDVGDEFEVMGVVEDGPAAEAGLQAGDRITYIDNQPSRALFLPELRITWRDRDQGTRIKINYKRGSEDRQTTIILRNLIAATTSTVARK